MKRDKNLQSLSRDHHHGLLLGWKIRQGIKHNVKLELIIEYVHYFAEAALFPHFKAEEEQIFMHLGADNKFKRRTVQEHRDVVALIGSLDNAGNKLATLLEIAKVLDDHIRFEEREFFPYLQEELSAAQLEEIGMAIDSIHQPFLENFHTEFWITHIN